MLTTTATMAGNRGGGGGRGILDGVAERAGDGGIARTHTRAQVGSGEPWPSDGAASGLFVGELREVAPRALRHREMMTGDSESDVTVTENEAEEGKTIVYGGGGGRRKEF